MDRRRFLTASLAGALVAPLAAWAQQIAARRVALVFTASPVATMTGPKPSHPSAEAFLEGLRERGWRESQNLILERRSAEGNFDRFEDILRELLDRGCDVIVTGNTRMALVAQRITKSVPIVMTGIAEPEKFGLVESLARPGGNLTGILGDPGADFESKRLQLLRDALPRATSVAFLESPEAWKTWGPGRQAAARALGFGLIHAATSPQDYTAAFTTILRKKVDAIILGRTAYLYAGRDRIMNFVKTNQIPLLADQSWYTDAGGLMSYGVNNRDYWRLAASYVDRVLRGANPAVLPIEQISTYELVFNLKTAKALGLMIPPSLRLQAQRVIE